MVKLSIVMSVYNEKKYLMESITSILNQTFKDFEFIIIDDGSDLSVRKVIESFKDGRIKLIINKENIGLTASLNKGLFRANGEYIARQDADDISQPFRLAEQVEYLDTNRDIGLIGSSCSIINESGDIIDDWEATPNPTNTLSERNKIAHGSVMFRRNVMEDLGKYDEHFKYSQDYDYWLRISKKYEIRNLPTRLYRLRVHGNMLGITKAEQQALFVILAQRKANGFTECRPLKYEQLDQKERIRYHNMVAYNLVQGNEMIKAMNQFETLFKIDPLNLENLVRIFACEFGGRNGILRTQNAYRKLRGYLQYL